MTGDLPGLALARVAGGQAGAGEATQRGRARDVVDDELALVVEAGDGRAEPEDGGAPRAGLAAADGLQLRAPAREVLHGPVRPPGLVHDADGRHGRPPAQPPAQHHDVAGPAAQAGAGARVALVERAADGIEAPARHRQGDVDDQVLELDAQLEHVLGSHAHRR